jgi:hypothetical protein
MFRRLLHFIATLTVLLAFVHQLPDSAQHDIIAFVTSTVVTGIRDALAAALDALR